MTEEQNKDKPSYYAVIPANVRYDPNLKDKAKLLYGEISALTNKTGECTATNNYFARLFKITTKTVSRLIQNLKNSGYIRVIINYKNDSKEVRSRIIKIVGQGYFIGQKDTDENDNMGIPQNVQRYPQNCPEGIPKNVQDNNTSNNKYTPYNPPNGGESYLQNFKTFWESYPKKQNKKKVENWFKRNNPSDELMKTILKKLELLKKTEQWNKNNKQFVPMPTTWLNGRRWEDEVIVENEISSEKNIYNGYEVL